MRLSVIIPCFNEAVNVKLTLERFKELLTSNNLDIEIIIVDGNSTDNTQEVLREEFKSLDSNIFKLLLLENRGGYGSDIMQGLNMATGDVLAWTHADMQTDVKDVLDAYDMFINEKESVVIKGKRKNRKFIEAFFTFGMQIFTFFVLKMYLSDINAQPKMFGRDLFNKIKDNAPSDFSLDLYLLFSAKKMNYTIKTISVYFKDRVYGEAKGGAGSWGSRVKLIKRTVKYILKLKDSNRG